MGDQMSGDELSLAPLIPWLSLIGAGLAIGTTLYNLLNSGAKRNAGRLESHAKRLGDHDQRLATIEQQQRSMPTKDDMHVLHLGMSEMRGDLREMRAAMDGNRQIMGRLETIVSRHEDHLLDGAKR